MDTLIPCPAYELSWVSESIRSEAIRNGALDPATLRFRIEEYQKCDGEFVGVRADDLAFCTAVAEVVRLVEIHRDSEFCLQPVGFVQ